MAGYSYVIDTEHPLQDVFGVQAWSLAAPRGDYFEAQVVPDPVTVTADGHSKQKQAMCMTDVA